jgi:hypothetical protein
VINVSRGKHLPLLLLALALLPLAAREARACSCGPKPPVLDAFERADYVVVLRVVSVERSEKAAPEGRMGDAEHYVAGVRSANMRVERVYKGRLKVGEELTFGQGGGADCVWTFSEKSVGQQYLFYLSPPGRGSKMWMAFTCGRSRPLRYAGDDLLYLNKLDEVRGKTRLSGTIWFAVEAGMGVGGRLVRVVGEKKTYEARTDASGVYEVYDLPPGTYTVAPEVPAGWKAKDFVLARPPGAARTLESPRRGLSKNQVAVEAGRHAGLDIGFDVDNAIRGFVSGPDGRPLDDVWLHLVPADGTKGRYLGDRTEAGGAFEIDEIPPGRYVLVVNDDGKVSSSEPFGTLYHPDAARREDATVFEIGVGDFLENVQIRVPKAEEVVTVEGVFLYSDGKPVVGEAVVFKAAGMERDEDDDIVGGVDGDARAESDARGRFRIKILKRLRGELYGTMYTYVGEFENCPKLDAIIKKSGEDATDLSTPAVKVQADADLYDVELRYAFPGCKKKARR